jgi:hypothetical protein
MIESEIIILEIKWYDSFENITFELLNFLNKTKLLNLNVQSIHIEASNETKAIICYTDDQLIPWKKIE